VLLRLSTFFDRRFDAFRHALLQLLLLLGQALLEVLDNLGQALAKFCALVLQCLLGRFLDLILGIIDFFR
jgi:hypothetical protein